MEGQNPTETNVAGVVDPALAASANPAADLAAAALKGLFGGAPQPQPAPAPAPAPEPPVPPPPVSIADRYAAPDPNAQPVVPTLPDIPPQEDIRLPENTAENVGHAFAAARAEAKKYRQMAEEFKAQVEKVRADYESYAQRESALAEKLTAEQNRAHDLEEKIGKMDLEQSPAFKAKYDAPISAIREEIAKTLVANGYQQTQADELSKQVVLAENAAAVAALPGVSELPSTVQGMLMYKFNESDGLWAQRNQALSEWRATQQGLQQTTVREDAVVSAQHRAELAATGLDRISKVVPQFIWNDPEFVKLRDTEVEKVKAWYGQAGEDQLAAAAVEGALVAPFAYRLVEGLGQKIVELQGVIDARNQLGSPRTVPYYHGAPPPPPPPKPDNGGEGKSWQPVEAGTDPLAAAGALASGALKKMFS